MLGSLAARLRPSEEFTSKQIVLEKTLLSGVDFDRLFQRDVSSSTSQSVSSFIPGDVCFPLGRRRCGRRSTGRVRGPVVPIFHELSFPGFHFSALSESAASHVGALLFSDCFPSFRGRTDVYVSALICMEKLFSVFLVGPGSVWCSEGGLTVEATAGRAAQTQVGF